MAFAGMKLKFRRLLSRISDGLGSENVNALKNLCYHHIYERDREDIEIGIDLFNVLVRKGKLKQAIIVLMSS